MDSLEWLGLIGWFVFTTWQIYNYSSGGTNTDYFNERYDRIEWAPARGVFSIMWPLLYFMLTAGVFLFWKDTSHEFYQIVLGLYVANIMLNKIWCLVFFGTRRPWISLLVLLVILGSAIAVLVLYGIATRGDSNLWISFGLYLPYVLWLGFATVLNAEFARKDAQIASPTQYSMSYELKAQ